MFCLVKSTQQTAQQLELKRFKDATDWELAHQYMNEEHSLGAGREAGDRCGQFFYVMVRS